MSLGACSCGRARRRVYRFCPGCGAAFADVARHESISGPLFASEPSPRAAATARTATRTENQERKQVTVLFSDICDSTELVVSMDPEEAQQVLDRALRLMSDAVNAYGGTVSQLLGDGLLALFGAPIAQEDHSLRACLAAIEMQRRSHHDGDAAHPISLRVGLHSGEVIVGAGGEFPDIHHRASGTTVHLASRLEQLARPGTVVMSSTTHRLIEGRIDTLPLGRQSIHGFRETLEVHEIVLDQTGSATMLPPKCTDLAPIVGRDEILGALVGLARQAAEGRMRMAGLRGDAGIGKSRIIAEFCAGLRAEGFNVRIITAHSYTSHVPYGVVSDFMRELLGIAHGLDPQQQREVARSRIAGWGSAGEAHKEAITDLLNLSGPGQAWSSLTPTQRRRRIGDMAYWLILGLLESGPLVLVFEDIFLGDRGSLRLLETIVRRLEAAPVFICATYRLDFEHRWGEAEWFTEHSISPLAPQHMATLATAMLGEDASMGSVIAGLVERAHGNPFFFEQLAMNMVDSGNLVGAPGTYRCKRPDALLRVPGSISAVISARVDHLPPASKAGIEAASILGEPISASLVGSMLGITSGDAAHRLYACVRAGLLNASTQAEVPMFSFCHGLVQEVVTAALTRPHRRKLHRSALTTMQQLHGEQNDELASILAHHATCGEEWSDAVKFALKAMSRAIARSANRDALRMFEIGLDAARSSDGDASMPALELGLRIKALGAMLPLGLTAEIVANLERAEAITKLIGDTRRQAAVLLQHSVLLWTCGSYRQGLDAADRASTAAINAGSSSLQLAAAQARMMQQHGLGRYSEVIAEGRSIEHRFGAELATRQIMPGWAVVCALAVKVFVADAHARMAEFGAAQASLDAAYGELQYNEHAYSRVLIDNIQGMVWIAQGRPAQAVPLLSAAMHSCKVNDLPTMCPPVQAALGGALAGSGRIAEAIALLEGAVAARLNLQGGRYNDYYLPIYLAKALALAGRHEEAIAAATAARTAAASFEQQGHEADALLVLAEIEIAAGREQDALTHFREAQAAASRCSMAGVVNRSAQAIAAHSTRRSRRSTLPSMAAHP